MFVISFCPVRHEICPSLCSLSCSPAFKVPHVSNRPILTPSASHPCVFSLWPHFIPTWIGLFPLVNALIPHNYKRNLRNSLVKRDSARYLRLLLLYWTFMETKMRPWLAIFWPVDRSRNYVLMQFCVVSVNPRANQVSKIYTAFGYRQSSISVTENMEQRFGEAQNTTWNIDQQIFHQPDTSS